LTGTYLHLYYSQAIFTEIQCEKSFVSLFFLFAV